MDWEVDDFEALGPAYRVLARSYTIGDLVQDLTAILALNDEGADYSLNETDHDMPHCRGSLWCITEFLRKHGDPRISLSPKITLGDMLGLLDKMCGPYDEWEYQELIAENEALGQ